MVTSLILGNQSSFKYLTISRFVKSFLHFHFENTEVLNAIRMVELQVLVESIAVLLGLHLLSVGLHPGIGRVPRLAVVLDHQVVLPAEGAVASVHCNAPGVGASLEARSTQYTRRDDTASQVCPHQH